MRRIPVSLLSFLPTCSTGKAKICSLETSVEGEQQGVSLSSELGLTVLVWRETI